MTSMKNIHNIIKIFLLLYASTLVDFTKELTSSQLYNFIDNNRSAKHFLLFAMSFVSLSTYIKRETTSTNHLIKLLTYSGGIYLTFILSTKMSLGWSLALLALLIGMFVYYGKICDEVDEIESDNTLDSNTKDKLMNRINDYKTYIPILLFVLILILGSFFYFDKKYVQYGGDFDIDNFVFKKGGKII